VAAGADLKGRHGIHRVDAETGAVEAVVVDEEVAGGVEVVVHDRNINMQPRLSPDGSKLFYKVNFRRQGDHSVSKSRFVVRDLVSGTVREFTALQGMPPGLEYAPSPDGRMVAFESRKDARGVSSISLLPLNGGEPREMLRVSAPQTLELYDWTPDGTHIIVRRVLSAKGDGDLLLYPVNGGAPRKIAIDNPGARAVSIHPGGKRIAYVVQGATSAEVVAMEGILTTLEKGR
jgi:Tol biopolymer transport system component